MAERPGVGDSGTIVGAALELGRENPTILRLGEKDPALRRLRVEPVDRRQGAEHLARHRIELGEETCGGFGLEGDEGVLTRAALIGPDLEDPHGTRRREPELGRDRED